MKLGNGANEVDVTNAQDYRTSLNQIIKDINIFTKTIDVEYTSFQKEHGHTLTRAKHEVVFWK